MGKTIYASSFGFLPCASADENREALQKALDEGGEIIVDKAGTYLISGAVLIGSNTRLVFSEGTSLKRVALECKYNGSVIMNRGAYTHEYDENIEISGLHLITNGVDSVHDKKIVGMNGHIGFFYIKHLKITDFECMDLGKHGFCIQICTFEDAFLENLRIEGYKDAVHFGPGRDFVVRNGEFRTYDDPIALNANDYATANPQMGWIENGLIENCSDLDQPETTGYFVRMLAGAWSDWRSGMMVRNSDTVVSCGRMYRAVMPPDGKEYISLTQPTHAEGRETLDGIDWVMIQDDNVCHNCGCRNIHFKNIKLCKHRPVAFSFHFDNDNYSHSYYPYADAPVQENITIENVEMQNDVEGFIWSTTPVTGIKLINVELKNTAIRFGHRGVPGIVYPPVDISMENIKIEGRCYVRAIEGRKAIVSISNSHMGVEASFGKKGDIEIVRSDIPVDTIEA